MVHTMDKETLKQKIDNGDSFHLVEVLMPKEYNRLHIKGAVNIPLKTIAKTARDYFDKNEEIVLYCADEDCAASTKAAEKLETFGYTRVFEYPGGKKEWYEAGLPVEGQEVS